MPFDVVVLGSANVDVVVQVTRLPAPGETVLGTGRTEHPGGKGLNQAVAAARTGASTAFVGTVGRDREGDLLLETMRTEGIAVGAVARVDEPTCTDASRSRKGPERRSWWCRSPGRTPSSCLGLTARRLPRRPMTLRSSALAPCSSSSSRSRSPGCSRESTGHAQRGALVLLNAAPARPLADSVLATVDVLVVNEHEAVALTNSHDPDQAAQVLAASVRDAIVTLGARGAVHVTRDGSRTSEPSRTAAVVDTTGAGDAFVGVLAAALATGSSVPQALHRAVAAGSLAVEKRGAVPSMPTYDEIDVRAGQ